MFTLDIGMQSQVLIQFINMKLCINLHGCLQKCYSTARSSICGKTVPEDKSHKKDRTQFFPIWTDLGWWITFLFFSTRIQSSGMATNHTINSPRFTGKTERFCLLTEPIRLHDKYRILPACELKKYKQLYCKFNSILMKMIFIYAAVPRHLGQGAKSRVLLREFP